jgi:hypothetical protein
MATTTSINDPTTETRSAPNSSVNSMIESFRWQAVAAAGRRPHLDGVIGAGAHLLKEQDHSVQ